MFSNALEKGFYAVVIVFSLILLATIVMGGRDSFYEKIEKKRYLHVSDLAR